MESVDVKADPSLVNGRIPGSPEAPLPDPTAKKLERPTPPKSPA